MDKCSIIIEQKIAHSYYWIMSKKELHLFCTQMTNNELYSDPNPEQQNIFSITKKKFILSFGNKQFLLKRKHLRIKIHFEQEKIYTQKFFQNQKKKEKKKRTKRN